MKVKYLIPILLAVLVFSFVGCSTPKVVTNTTKTQTETTVIKTTIPETTAAVTKTTIDESKDYADKMASIFSKVATSMSAFSQSMEDASNGKISISKNKQDTSNFIKDINDCYNTFLSLKVPEKFNTPHELMRKGMEHLINATTYLQQYIDSNNTNDMEGYLKKATSEMLMSNDYINKANEQYNNLK